MEKYSDIHQSKYQQPKHQNRKIQLLLFLTGLLWLVFLYKVFFVTEAKKTSEIISASPTNQKIHAVTATNRNKKSIKQIEPPVVEAVRASFEKDNPRKNDQIIRGKISKINVSQDRHKDPYKTQHEIQAKESAEDKSGSILKMLNDNVEIRSLNKDYKQALKNEGKIFYQGHYY